MYRRLGIKKTKSNIHRKEERNEEVFSNRLTTLAYHSRYIAYILNISRYNQ